MTNTGTTDQIPTNCHNCGDHAEGTGTIIGSTWTGTEYVRAVICQGCSTAALAAGKSGASYFENAPRKPRRKRTPQPLYGDLAYVAMLNGISTDGTGRKVG